MLTVRHATLTDVDALLRLVREFITTTPYARFLRVHEPALRPFVGFLVERGPFFVAVQGGAAGEEPIGGTKMLDELAWWVDPSYRNARTGPKLLGAFEDWALEHGVDALTMKEPKDSGVGVFYKHNGFEPVETVWFKRLRG